MKKIRIKIKMKFTVVISGIVGLAMKVEAAATGPRYAAGAREMPLTFLGQRRPSHLRSEGYIDTIFDFFFLFEIICI